jgi:hypothetical protein
MGRSVAFPNSRDLVFSSTEATWYRFRVASQPFPEALTETIVTTANAGHGGYLFPPYRDGRWTDPLDHTHVDLAGLGVAMTSSQGGGFVGALEFGTDETHLVVRAVIQALHAGTLWSLCCIPRHGKMILATDEDGDLIGSFPEEGAQRAFLRALGKAGWMEPTEPDPRVSETDPWLTL